jgi:small ubiquitin-related modifier
MSDPVKNEPAEDSKGGATITIRVKEQAGEETYFKVKRSTKMSKVFDAFALRKGVQRKALRFLLDGERVLDDQTPESLDLEENDQIDCKWTDRWRATARVRSDKGKREGGLLSSRVTRLIN